MEGFVLTMFDLAKLTDTSDLSTIDWSDFFPVLKHGVHLNHAGVAPLSAPAAAAIRDYAVATSEQGDYQTQRYAEISELRRTAAKLINARSENEIAFIPNTSTGISQVARGLTWQAGDQVVITNVDYPANRYPWESLRARGVELVEVQQLPDGRIDVEDVLDAISDRTKLVAISHVQYASGFRIDLKPISEMVHRVGGYLSVDAIQSVGALPVDVQAMGIDFLSADGHKWMLGPEGAGLFYCHEDLVRLLEPNVIGWLNVVDPHNYGDFNFTYSENARRFEPGCWNVPGLLGLKGSLDLIAAIGVDRVWARIEALTKYFEEAVQTKGYRVYSPRAEAGERSGIVMFELGERGKHVEASAKAIVKELNEEKIVIALREGRLRVSPHFYNSEAQLDEVVGALP